VLFLKTKLDTWQAAIDLLAEDTEGLLHIHGL